MTVMIRYNLGDRLFPTTDHHFLPSFNTAGGRDTIYVESNGNWTISESSTQAEYQ